MFHKRAVIFDKFFRMLNKLVKNIIITFQIWNII